MSNSTVVQTQLSREGLSPKSSSMIIANLMNHVQLGQGVGVDALATDQATLVCWVIDRTGSMSGNRSDLIKAYNEGLAALKASKASDEILMQTLLFDSDQGTEVLHGYLPIDQVPDLSQSTYILGGMTNLHDATFDGISGAVAYGASLRNGGTITKVVVVIMTDGGENASRDHSERELRTLIEDLLREEIYTIALVAFGFEGNSYAGKIGIPAGNVLNAGSTASEIRRALGTVSNSTIRASQTSIATGSQSFFN